MIVQPVQNMDGILGKLVDPLNIFKKKKVKVSTLATPELTSQVVASLQPPANVQQNQLVLAGIVGVGALLLFAKKKGAK